MADRSQDWEAAMLRACQSQGLSEEQVKSLRARALLKPTKQTSEFGRASRVLVQSISDLREFIKLHQKDYLSNSGSKDDKDRMEAEVGLLIKACAQQIEQLKNSVLAAQGSSAAPAASVHVLRQQQEHQGKGLHSSKPTINAQTAAHLHGVVLHIAELLHSVSSRFDKCRAHRYQQASNQRKPLPLKGSHFELAGGSASSKPSTQPSHPSSTSEAQAAGGRGSAQSALNRFGTSFLGHVREAKGALQCVDGPSSRDQDPAYGRSGEQLQQQQQLDQENSNLVAQLSSTAAQAQGIESTLQDIAVLNQMFSTAVLHQAESIEAIYAAAVDASHNISSGNVELRKAVQYGRSSQKIMLALLLIATLCLLFLDWFNS